MVNLLKITKRWVEYKHIGFWGKTITMHKSREIEINIEKIVEIHKYDNEYSVYLESEGWGINIDKHDYNKIKKAIKLIKIK